MDGGAWWATVHEVAQRRMQLSNFRFTLTLLKSSVLCLTHESADGDLVVLAALSPGTWGVVPLPLRNSRGGPGGHCRSREAAGSSLGGGQDGRKSREGGGRKDVREGAGQWGQRLQARLPPGEAECGVMKWRSKHVRCCLQESTSSRRSQLWGDQARGWGGG